MTFRKICTLLLLSAPLTLHAFSEPTPTDLELFKPYTPENWELLTAASGDLNGDKINDYAIVVKDTNSEKIVKFDDGRPTLDRNQRDLIILLGQKGTKELQVFKHYKNKVAHRDMEIPNMEEPFEAMSISAKGILNISYEIFMSMGGWEVQNMTFRFRLNKKHDAFKLIGYDYHNRHRASGMFEERSYNLLTHKQKSVSGSMSSPKHKEQWSKFKPAQRWTLDAINDFLAFNP